MTAEERLQTVQNCMAWVDEGAEGRRSANIDYRTGHTFQVWCYDFDLASGMFVTSPRDVIDLEAKKEREERAMYERLAAKFGK